MAYDELTAQRIREILLAKGADFYEKKMFSGICFMVDDKLCCGTHVNKDSGESVMLCRIGEARYVELIERDDCVPMNFTGRTMKGYVYVTEQGIRDARALEFWLQCCLDFNPEAQRSKR